MAGGRQAVGWARRHIGLVLLLTLVLVVAVTSAIGCVRYGQGGDVPGDRDDVFETP